MSILILIDAYIYMNKQALYLFNTIEFYSKIDYC